MTEEQDQLITFLFIKHGGFEAVVDMWLYDEEALSYVERAAVEAWLSTEQGKPHNLQWVKDVKHPYLTVEIDLDKG